MKALTLTLTLTCLLLASCVPSPDSTANPHDMKYMSIEVDSDLCVRDTQTQLMWQAKDTKNGLNNAANTYSWFDPTETNGELDYRGLEGGGTCEGSVCDIWHYVRATNEAGYCGRSDWRMPSKDELYSISDLLRAENPPTINTAFFPNTKSAEYWTGNDYNFQWDAAWAWSFEFGHDRVDWKKEAKFVRLVRGTAGELEPVKE